MIRKIVHAFRSILRWAGRAKEQGSSVTDEAAMRNRSVNLITPKLTEVLDALPESTDALSRCRKSARGGEFDLIYSMGPLICGGEASLLCTEKRWQKNPTMVFCGFASTNNLNRDKALPEFIACVKVSPPHNVKRHTGDCYQYLLYHSWKGIGKKGGEWFGGYVFVDEVGKVTLARQRHIVKKRLPPTRIAKQRVDRVVPTVVWQDTFFDLFAQPEPDEAAELVVKSAFNFWSERARHWLVVTKRQGQRISFAVDEGQHKYFFKDRDKVVTTPTGQRKKIFHVVCEHERITRSGRKTIVKEHTRGARHFDWHGYECHIFSPGWHGADVFSDLDLTLYGKDELTEIGVVGVEPKPIVEKAARVMEGTNVRLLRKRDKEAA